MPYHPRHILPVICIYWILLLPAMGAENHKSASDHEDTMLIFVGENLDVLSIASRREESAWQAPAVAQVITRKEIRESGSDTLSYALNMIPGFYMGHKEWGTQPYLRGIPDSVLFLYDTVSICSDISKTIHPLDDELSLASVKRIEIIRGPGSVLWGPDAFAGIVNVVPMSGKDLDGVETGILYGMPGEQEVFYLNAGHDTGNWDAFLSLSGHRDEEDDACNVINFWDNKASDPEKPVASQDRFGEKYLGTSRYLEASGRFSYKDWFTLSGRISDNQKSYAMSDSTGDLIWTESRSNPFSLIKLEIKKIIDRASAIRFTGSYTLLDTDYQIIDRILEQKESTSYGEIIYDRSFFTGQGLFTGGISYREKHIKNAPIWDSYLPDYLGSGNQDFLPGINEKDYAARLWSVFAQYSHKFGNLDLWFGIRNDAHDTYQDHVSFNTGGVWTLSSQWMLKTLYGTAYRTPFARQLLEDEKPDLENIENFSVQLLWMPHKSLKMEVCGFYSQIKNHIMEDPFAGLSQPNRQQIQGMEIDFQFSPHKTLDFSANLTLLDNDGPEETYKYNYYTFERPDGTEEKYYMDLTYPFDRGPDTIFNFTTTWHPNENLTAFLRLGYFSSRQLVYPRNETSLSVPGAWVLDVSTVIEDIFQTGMDLDISVKNLTDNHYETPGTYNIIEGNPISGVIMLRKKW